MTLFLGVEANPYFGWSHSFGGMPRLLSSLAFAMNGVPVLFAHFAKGGSRRCWPIGLSRRGCTNSNSTGSIAATLAKNARMGTLCGMSQTGIAKGGPPAYGPRRELTLFNGEGQYMTDISPSAQGHTRKEILAQALFGDPVHWGTNEIGYLEIQFDQNTVQRV